MSPSLFTHHPLALITDYLRQRMAGALPGDVIPIQVLDPDQGSGRTSGETITLEGITYKHRSHRTWVDLAEVLDLRYLTPKPAQQPLITLRFQVLDQTASPHLYRPAEIIEKYGTASPYYRIEKLEEPHFLTDYREALDQAKLHRNDRVLDLGVHRGDELAPLHDIGIPLQITGIDHCPSALTHASQRFPQDTFHCRDLADNHALDVDATYHLLIAIGTLQSPGFEGKALFNTILQRHLEPRAAIILGWPNGRYLDGEVKYGAKVKNYRKPELSLLVKDLAHYRRVLQKKGFQVTLRGKYYIFLTAVRQT